MKAQKVIAVEEISEIAPVEMNYSFDSMDNEQVPNLEYGAFQVPQTFIVNDNSHQMC